jgi:branched-chain amino acid transport system substrate-binding protein
MKKLMTTALLLALVAAGTSAQVIKIATQSPLSGGQSAFGEQLKLGAQYAIEEAQANFKKLGFDLQLAAYDDQALPDTGVANANRIINDPDIFGVVGHFNSGVMIPSSEVYKTVNLVVVSPANTNPRVTDRLLPNVNRICGRDDVQGPAGAAFAVNELKAKKIFVLNDKSAYGQGLAQAFKDAAVKLGANIPASAFVGTEEKTNFIPIITQIMAFGPDLVYFGGTYDQIGPFTKQLRERGLKMPVLGGDGLDSGDYITLAGVANASNTYYTTVAGPVTMFPKAAALAKGFKAKFGKDIEGFGIYAYDCAKIILSSLEASIKANGGKKPTRDAVTKAVRAIKYEGLTGMVTFDTKGDIAKADYFILKYDAAGVYANNAVIKSISVDAPAAPAAM